MSTPNIVEFGPIRTVGVRYVGKNQNGEIPAMWGKEFVPRMHEFQRPAGGISVGICRCIPGVSDGSFEYFASAQVVDNAPIPAGMHEVQIPRGHYMVIPVANLGKIGEAWKSIPSALAALPEWAACCCPAGCQCASRPSFEYYPPEFCPEKAPSFFLYIAVSRK